MTESGPQIENPANAGGHPDREVKYEKHGPRWLVGLFIATSVLIIVAAAAYLLFGRELFQRPFLMMAVVIAWLGALVGISIGHEAR